jgi:hypothetical protein
LEQSNALELKNIGVLIGAVTNVGVSRKNNVCVSAGGSVDLCNCDSDVKDGTFCSPETVGQAFAQCNNISITAEWIDVPQLPSSIQFSSDKGYRVCQDSFLISLS